MFSDSLTNNNQALQIGPSTGILHQQQQLNQSNHPITGSDAMIKEYCKKEMLEIQRQQFESNQKQACSSQQNLAVNPTNNQSSLSTNQVHSQIDSQQQNLNANTMEDFQFGVNLDNYGKYNDDEDNNQKCGGGSNSNNGNQGRWTKEEHLRFVEGLSLYGKNWKKVEEHVESRTGAQIRSHAQKFFNKLEREYNKKHGLLISLNTSSSTKQSNMINNENINTLSASRNLSLKKTQSCMMPQQNLHNNTTKILGEKNQNNTKNILNNIQSHQNQQQFEQNFFLGQAIEASLQAAKQSISLPQQPCQQNSLLKKALLQSVNIGSQVQNIQNPILAKSISLGNGSPQYGMNIPQSQQMNQQNFEVQPLLPSLSLRNRSDSVASNFTMISEEDKQLTDEDLKKIKDSLPQMVNSQSLNECIQHYTQLTLNLQKQLLQSNNVQKNAQIQQQINTLQSAVQFLHAYSSMNKTPQQQTSQTSFAPSKEIDAINNENIAVLTTQNTNIQNNQIKNTLIQNKMKFKNENNYLSTNNQSNKENDIYHESAASIHKQGANCENLKKQQIHPQQAQTIQNIIPSIQLQESDRPTDYESFFHFILKKYGKIFDHPQSNSNLINCQPRLNQFLNFDGDYNSSRQIQSNILQQVKSSPCNNSLNSSQGLKNSSEIGSSQGLPNILLRARKSSFTLCDNEDDLKLQKLNLLRKKICTEKENNRTNLIVQPSLSIPKTEVANKQSTFLTILTQQIQGATSPQNLGIQNHSEYYLNECKGVNQQGITQEGSSLLDIQNLLDDHHIRSTTNEDHYQQTRKDSIPMRSRFSFSENNSQVPQINSQQVIEEDIDQERLNQSCSIQDDPCVENQAIEEQQRKLLEAYSKLQQLLVMKNNQQNPAKVSQENQIVNRNFEVNQKSSSLPQQQQFLDTQGWNQFGKDYQVSNQTYSQFNINSDQSKQQSNIHSVLNFNPKLNFCNNLLFNCNEDNQNQLDEFKDQNEQKKNLEDIDVDSQIDNEELENKEENI